MNEHSFPTQQVVNGEIVSPPREICLTAAKRVFKERKKEGDTNPKIVKMKIDGKEINHWYYRSDQWVEQPYIKTADNLLPYIGPAENAPPSLFGNGTFIDDVEATEIFGDK